MFRTGWMVPVAAVAATGLLVSCSSGGSSASSSVTKAVNATIAAGSVSETMKAEVPTASGKSTSSGTGSYAFASSEGTFKVDTGSVVGTVTALVKDQTLYVHLTDAIAKQFTNGKTWVTASMTTPPTVPGTGNLLAVAGGGDPAFFLEGLQDGLVSAKKTDSTHYTATVNLSTAASKAPSSRKAIAQAEIKLLGGSQVSDAITLDSSGRIAAIVASVSVSGGATSTITVTYTGYGTAVNITIPPASQTIDAAKLLGP